MPTFLLPSRLLPTLLLLALAAVPTLASVLDQPFYVGFFARLLIYGLAATALNLALGYCGLIGFGHALFIGLGAYSVALPAHFGIDNALIHLALGLIACGVLAALTGLICLRTSGIAFIMITLAFAQMGYFAFVSLKHFGGDDGLSITRTSRIGGLDFGSPTTLYFAALILLGALLLWKARLRSSPFGMTLRAIRQNGRRVSALGLPVLHYQLAAYTLSAMLCGVAGFLLANLTAFASPGMMSWQVSGELIVMVVLGGIGTVFGPLYGALALMGVEEILKEHIESWPAIVGPAIVLVALSGRAGVAGLLTQLDSYVPGQRGSRPAKLVVQGESQ